MTRILFVCTGNTCRSPMAEAILKSKELPNVEVKSAGVYAMDGAGASPNTKTVLDENRIPHNHVSSMLTKDLVEWADYILTMTSGHKATILSMYPNANDKTFTLKEFAGETSNSDISDPYGGTVDIYRKTYNEMILLIDQIVARLHKEN